MKQKRTTQKGFVLAFSLLLSSVILSLAFGIFNILLKELILLSSAKDSQMAFYAADAAIECALYWDTHSDFGTDAMGTFATSSGFIAYNGGNFRSGLYDSNTGVPIPKANITCFNASAYDISITSTATEAETTLKVTLFGSPNTCATLKIKKTPSQLVETSIQSYGYNTCNASASRKTERAILVTY